MQTPQIPEVLEVNVEETPLGQATPAAPAIISAHPKNLVPYDPDDGSEHSTDTGAPTNPGQAIDYRYVTITVVINNTELLLQFYEASQQIWFLGTNVTNNDPLATATMLLRQQQLPPQPITFL